MSFPKTVTLTILALIAFAGNSVLARVALVDGAIDAVPFTAIRIASGAVVLALVLSLHSKRPKHVAQSGSLFGSLSLLGYAAFFSWAYLDLGTGMGALILFASVQLTMIGWGFIRGERLGVAGLLGTLIALAGLVWLLLPSLDQPDPLAAMLMIGSGFCWGVYSLLGRGKGAPLAVTVGNFIWATAIGSPILLITGVLGVDQTVTYEGAALAVASGAVTSGLGYAIWYAALKGLSASRAGIVQLAVPPLAALGGIALLSEPLTLRLSVASATILFGIALALIRRPAYANSK